MKRSIQTRPYPFETLEPTKLAWMAGLLQGEAYFSVDKRVRSKSNDPLYTPPPGVPIVKLVMIEEDLMEHYSELVGENLVPEKRKTTAGNQVYKVSIQAREKTYIFLKAILPYVIGEKTTSKIHELIAVCEEYEKWKAACQTQPYGLGL
jgi:hypothetical protein